MTNDAADPKPDQQDSNIYQELRSLLLSKEQDEIERLAKRLENPVTRAEDIAEVLPDAINNASKNKRALTSSLNDTVDDCIRSLIQKDPKHFADALFPIMGPAIRKSITETLKSFMQGLNEVLEQNMSMKGWKWRYEAWRTKVPYAQLVLRHTLLYRVEQVFLIHQDTGVLIAHVAHSDIDSGDSDAISGMLTVIKDFVRDSFSKDNESLGAVEIGEHTLWVLEGPGTLMAGVIRGIPPLELKTEFQSVLETLHQQYGEKLEHFSGEQSDVPGIEIHLEECLKEKKASGSNESEKSLFSWPLLLALIALFIVLGYFYYQSYQTKKTLADSIAVLNQAPGIVVLDGKEKEGQYHIHLMRDQYAEQPETLIRNHEFPIEQYQFKITPYDSLDPHFALEHTIDFLSPPESVNVRKEGSSLMIAGGSTRNWYEKVQYLLPRLKRFGFETINIDGLYIDNQIILEEARRLLKIPDEIKTTLSNNILTLSGITSIDWIDSLNEKKWLIDGISVIDSKEVIASDESLEQRMHSMLTPPNTINIHVKDKHLILSGQAKKRWIEESNTKMMTMPWFQSINTNTLLISEEIKIQTLLNKLNKVSIYFSENTDLTTGNKQNIHYAANLIDQIQLNANTLEKSFSVMLTGFVDDLGDSQRNQALKQARAESVKNLLESFIKNNSLIEIKENTLIIYQAKTPKGLPDMTMRRVDIEAKVN